MRFPLGTMTVGDILDRGLKLLLARLPVFYTINLIVLTPVILVQLAAPFVVEGAGRPDPATMGAALGVTMFAVLLALILQPICTASILYIVMEEYAGRRRTIGEAFSFALTRFLPLIGASILVGVLVFVGMLMCCLPGIYLGVAFAFVSQVVVLEKLGPIDALSRSQRLVSGFWWRVFGVLFFIGLANLVIQMAIGAGLGFALPTEEVIPTDEGNRVQLNPVNHIITILVAQLVNILFTTYIAVCTTLLYLDQRIRKEGFDLELAAQLGEEPGRRVESQADFPDELDDPERRRRRLDEF